MADAARPVPELELSDELEELFKTTRPFDGGAGPGVGTNGLLILVLEHIVH